MIASSSFKTPPHTLFHSQLLADVTQMSRTSGVSSWGFFWAVPIAQPCLGPHVTALLLTWTGNPNPGSHWHAVCPASYQPD